MVNHSYVTANSLGYIETLTSILGTRFNLLGVFTYTIAITVIFGYMIHLRR